MAKVETQKGIRGRETLFSRFWLWAVAAAVLTEFDVILGLGFETAALY